MQHCNKVLRCIPEGSLMSDTEVPTPLDHMELED